MQRQYTLSRPSTYIMSFGIHSGKQLRDVPATYLLKLYDNYKGLDLSMKEFIRINEAILQFEKENPGKVLK